MVQQITNLLKFNTGLAKNISLCHIFDRGDFFVFTVVKPHITKLNLFYAPFNFGKLISKAAFGKRRNGRTEKISRRRGHESTGKTDKSQYAPCGSHC